MAAKDFGPIESDYAFFMAHATEAENDAAQYVRELRGFDADRSGLRMLDFGCGAGDFTHRLLSALRWSPQVLDLTLMEPVPQHRERARLRLAEFSARPVRVLEQLNESPQERFDLIISNHVLYYVDDLEGTLARLAARLDPGGRLLLAIAGWTNALMELWQSGFEHLGIAPPYHGAEDVAAALYRRGLDFRTTRVPYELRFQDREEHRLSVLRFLFGDYLSKLPKSTLLAAFNPYARGGVVVIETDCLHFAVSAA